MGKTLAQLKRDAKVGNLIMELQPIGNWSNGLPERLKGKRRLVDANSKAIFFLNADGRKSECRIERASLVDYTDDALTIYYYGHRAMNDAERSAMAEWKAITETEQYKKDLEYDVLTDYNQCYYRQVRFWKEKDMEYMMGFEWKGGCKFDFNARGEELCVWDMNVKGDISLQYKIIK